MRNLSWFLLVCLALVGAYLLIVPSRPLHAGESVRVRDTYSVECDYETCIRWDKDSGVAWILSCPGGGIRYTTCEWEFIEERPQ